MAWGSGVLRQGASGEDVRQLQQWLIDNGFPLPRWGADGNFGDETRNALINFQRSRGIADDGVVGRETWGQILGSTPSRSQATVTAPRPAAPRSENELIDELLRGDFGALIAPFVDIPELRPFIAALAPLPDGTPGWTVERFRAAVRQTEWWRANTQVQQEWMSLSPAEQSRRREDVFARMLNVADSLYGKAQFSKSFGGVGGFRTKELASLDKITDGRMTFETWQVQFSLNARQVSGTQAFSDEMARQEALAVRLKRPEEWAEELWQKAHGEYFIHMKKGAARKWAENIISGKSSFGEFNDFVRAEAAKLYPRFAESIGNGVLPKSLFAPVLGLLSEELEISEEAVVANKSLWGQIINNAAADKGGFTASDWVRYARATPQWKFTRGANEMQANFNTRLLEQFGEIA